MAARSHSGRARAIRGARRAAGALGAATKVERNERHELKTPSSCNSEPDSGQSGLPAASQLLMGVFMGTNAGQSKTKNAFFKAYCDTAPINDPTKLQQAWQAWLSEQLAVQN